MPLIITSSNGGAPKTYVHSDNDEAAARMICTAFYQGYTIVSIEPTGPEDGDEYKGSPGSQSNSDTFTN